VGCDENASDEHGSVFTLRCRAVRMIRFELACCDHRDTITFVSMAGTSLFKQVDLLAGSGGGLTKNLVTQAYIIYNV
jgi:hypothetical protein